MSPLLSVEGLSIAVPTAEGEATVVRDVSFTLERGETLGIVGESGSGKTMTARSILRLLPPSAHITSGAVVFDGEDLTRKSDRDMRAIRGRGISIILQDSLASLNPVFPIGQQLAEPLRADAQTRRARRRRPLRDAAERLLAMVQIDPRRDGGVLRRYPFQFSGGMRQRVVGAISLARHPALLIADEPTTALDVMVQAGYLELLKDLQRTYGFGLIIISHDLGVVSEVSDRVAVMYGGRIVESGPTSILASGGRHPYTQALVSSLPNRNLAAERLPHLRGDPPNPVEPVVGCAFAPRCEHASPVCVESRPQPVAIAPAWSAACWLLDDLVSTTDAAPS